MQTGLWQHVLWSHDGVADSGYIMVDGVVEVTNSDANQSVTPGDPRLLFAASTGGLQGFQGAIDEIRIWNVALSSNDAPSAYNATVDVHPNL